MTMHAAAYDGNLGYLAQDDRQLMSALLDDTPGVFTGLNSNYSGLAVSAGAGLTSSIAAGRGAVLNSYQATQGGLWVVRNDAAVATSAHAATSSHQRWDCVGVRVYDSDTGGDSSDVTVPLIVQGTESASAAIGTGVSITHLGTANMTGAPGQSGGPAFPNNFLPLSMVLIPNPEGSSSSGFSYLDWRQFLSLGPSVWVPLFPTYVTCTSTVGLTPAARLENNGTTVRMKGGLQNTSSITSWITLPVPFRPSSQVNFTAPYGAGTFPIVDTPTTGSITTGGVVSLNQNAEYFYLDGITYSLT